MSFLKNMSALCAKRIGVGGIIMEKNEDGKTIHAYQIISNDVRFLLFN